MIKKDSKKKVKKGFAVSGIFLMVMSMFAFSVIISESEMVYALDCYTDAGKKIAILGTSCAAAGYQNVNPGLGASQSGSPNPTPGLGGSALKQVSSSTTKMVVNYNGGDYLVTRGALTDGSKVGVTDLFTGEQFELELNNNIINTARGATQVESLFGSTIVDTTGGKVTLSTVIKNGELSSITQESLNQLKITDINTAENSFVKEGVKYTLDPNGALTSTQIKTYEIFGTTLTGTWAHLAQGATWALGIIAAIQVLGPMFGLRDETTSALTKSTLIGVVAWKGLDIFAPELADSLTFLPQECLKNPAQGLGWCSAGAGAAIALIAFLMMYTNEEEKVVTFTCLPWQAPTGGENCEQCNNQAGELPCSEYQCKSLGQSCDLVNKGTDEEKCVWVNRQDVNPPTIEPLDSALLNGYRYSPDNAVSPPDRGVKVNYLNSNDNCVPAFTPLQFGVQLDEPASCKVDVLRKNSFDEMTSFMSSGLLDYNHTFTLSLPGSSNLQEENITIQNDGNYALYVRCQDSNGNANTATFLFKYCVDPGPDTTPAIIVTTSIVNNGAIAYNKSSVDLEVYTNEPASCRWSHYDQDYESMEEQMQCSSSIFESNAQMLYKCSTTLTGIKDRTDNNFYFRCLDQPKAEESKRNVNAESYVFTLKGTQPLVIDSANPDNETVKDSTDPVKVTLNATTSAGYDEGDSICYYSPTGNEESYIKFFDTDSYRHSQDLYLSRGFYEYFIKCTDLGGNSDYEEINFTVETDTSSPNVVRAYKEDNYLKLITNEAAECVYSTFSCNYAFDEGTQITTLEDKNHYTDWATQTDLYVKCRDEFENQPNPDECSIVVRGNNF